MPAKKISAEELVGKFKERNNNREPRNPGELVQFSKKLRGIQPIGFGEARKYFEAQASSPARKRRPRPKQQQQETKEPEEKQEQEAATEQQDPPTDGDTATETDGDGTAFQIGEEVKLTKDRTGMIRFIGTVDFAEGLFYGIELHSQFVGNSDGSKNGRRYFQCDANRGLFVPEKKIRRKMTKSDHVRKESWLAANAERNSRRTPEPPELGETILEEQKQQVEEESTAEPEPATEETEVSEEAPADVPAESAEEPPAEEPAAAEAPDAGNEEKENGVEDENYAEEQEQQPAEENGDVKEEEPAEEPPVEQLVVEEAESRPSYNASEEYYPAKEGDNLLQFVANQPDLTLRSQLFDFFMRSKTTARLQMVFESLQVFPPGTQRNLLCVDLLPRLEQFANQ